MKSKEKKYDSFFLITIGSEAVRCAIFDVDKVKTSKTFGKPLISYAQEVDLPLLEKTDFKSLYDVTIKSLNDLLKKIRDENKVIPKDVHVVLESPWYMSQTRIVSIEKKDPFLITKKFMLELKEKEHQIFRNDHKGEFAGEKDVVLEEKIMSVRLNGYDIKDPVGKKAKSFSMALYISIASQDAINGFNKVIHNSIPHAHIMQHSSAFSAFVPLRDVLSHMQDFLILSIEGELSDIHYINSGVLFESITVPYGIHSSIREIANKMNKGISDVLAFVRMSNENTLEVSANREMVEAIESSHKLWTEWFEKGLQALAKGSVVPTNIFLVSDGDSVSWIKKAIENERFMNYRVGGLSFAIEEVGYDYLKGYFTGGIKAVNIHPMSMLYSMYIYERIDV